MFSYELVERVPEILIVLYVRTCTSVFLKVEIMLFVIMWKKNT